MRQSMYCANDTQKLAKAKHHFGMRVEALGWMAFDTWFERDPLLSNVPPVRGHNATPHRMVIAQRFQTEMETAHLVAYYFGEEYAKAVSAHLDPGNAAAHD
jgi:hypothetical protein